MQRYYFDHNATTPVSPEVLEAMAPCFTEVYGNASSIHHFGQMAKQRLEMARRQTAVLLHPNPEQLEAVRQTLSEIGTPDIEYAGETHAFGRPGGVDRKDDLGDPGRPRDYQGPTT